MQDARQRIAGVTRATPTYRSESLSRIVGRPVLLKPEHTQRTGSFKIRGAYNFCARLAGEGEPPHVVAASAGNHAQGVALAASLLGQRATIFMPVNAALPKVRATRDYGAEIRLEGDDVDEAIELARRFAARTGAVLVPPFDHPDVIAGQGTVGLEVAEEAPEAEVVVVAVGGGGLISGVATALTGLRPGTQVVGVEAAGAACMRASLEHGGCVRLERVTTMADGIATRTPSELTLAHVRAHVADLVSVSEDELSGAVLLLLERVKAVVEPAGAAPLAAILAGKIPGRGPVVAVLSGGNVDPLLLIKLIEHGLSVAGRYLLLRIVLDDRPGALARLTGVVAGLGLNVLSVEHHRAGLDLPIDKVEVLLTVETRDPAHRGEVIQALRTADFAVELLVQAGAV